jgi:hypothetical protein
MMFVSQGPARDELLSKLATTETVKFGHDDSKQYGVELLCAVGCWDLLIELPRGPQTDPANVFAVAGAVTYDYE